MNNHPSNDWKLLEAMMEVVPIGMTYIAPDLEVLYANPAIKNYHGFNSSSELIGSYINDLFPPHVMEFIRPIINATLNGETVSFLGRTDEQGQLLLNDDNFIETYYFQTTYLPHVSNETVKGIIIIIEEITSLKRAELELTEKNNYLEQFTHMLAHDVKEPVRTVKTYGDLLSRKLANRLDEQEQRFLVYMIDSAQRLYDFIEGLRAFNAIDSEDLGSSQVNLNSIVQAIKDNLQLRVQETMARIESDNLPVIQANEVLLTQLFQNLVSNGIKFSREEVVPVINIRYTEEEKHHLICIEDNGIGIRKEDQESVFNLFYRLKVKPDAKGTGLGLAICRKIVRYYKGDIWVASTEGQGTTFCFRLPKTD